ncbi:MAG: hypothetical protein ACK4JE_00410, partial [Endomicrobiia bacterium]
MSPEKTNFLELANKRFSVRDEIVDEVKNLILSDSEGSKFLNLFGFLRPFTAFRVRLLPSAT